MFELTLFTCIMVLTCHILLTMQDMWRIVPNGFIFLKNSVGVLKSCGIKPASVIFEVCHQIEPYLILNQC